MDIINRRTRMASIARKLRREGKTVAFVPTMGALHDGHLALVSEARQMSDVLIVSVFVNPAQFNEQTDLDNYPRDLASDVALLTEYEVDYVFAPDAEEIYGPQFSTYVYVEGLTDTLEGASRPGHFRGVSTVVTILLNTIRPDLAFFGEKDAQQLAVIRRLTKDLGFETEIVPVATVRDPSGLAMSSRNALLTDGNRARAAVIFQALSDARNAFQDGVRTASKLVETVHERLASEPEAKIDYVAVVDPDSFEPVDRIEDSDVVVAVAVRFGKIRLIDNVILKIRQ